MWNKVACWRRQCNYCRAHAARHPVPCAGLVHSSACCCPSGLLCWQTAGMAALPLNGCPPLCPLPLLPRMQRAREPDAAEVRRRRNQQKKKQKAKAKAKGKAEAAAAAVEAPPATEPSSRPAAANGEAGAAPPPAAAGDSAQQQGGAEPAAGPGQVQHQSQQGAKGKPSAAKPPPQQQLQAQAVEVAGDKAPPPPLPAAEASAATSRADSVAETLSVASGKSCLPARSRHPLALLHVLHALHVSQRRWCRVLPSGLLAPLLLAETAGLHLRCHLVPACLQRARCCGSSWRTLQRQPPSCWPQTLGGRKLRCSWRKPSRWGDAGGRSSGRLAAPTPHQMGGLLPCARSAAGCISPAPPRACSSTCRLPPSHADGVAPPLCRCWMMPSSAPASPECPPSTARRSGGRRSST